MPINTVYEDPQLLGEAAYEAYRKRTRRSNVVTTAKMQLDADKANAQLDLQWAGLYGSMAQQNANREWQSGERSLDRADRGLDRSHQSGLQATGHANARDLANANFTLGQRAADANAIRGNEAAVRDAELAGKAATAASERALDNSKTMALIGQENALSSIAAGGAESRKSAEHAVTFRRQQEEARIDSALSQLYAERNVWHPDRYDARRRELEGMKLGIGKLPTPSLQPLGLKEEIEGGQHSYNQPGVGMWWRDPNDPEQKLQFRPTDQPKSPLTFGDYTSAFQTAGSMVPPSEVDAVGPDGKPLVGPDGKPVKKPGPPDPKAVSAYVDTMIDGYLVKSGLKAPAPKSATGAPLPPSPATGVTAPPPGVPFPKNKAEYDALAAGSSYWHGGLKKVMTKGANGG